MKEYIDRHFLIDVIFALEMPLSGFELIFDGIYELCKIV